MKKSNKKILLQRPKYKNRDSISNKSIKQIKHVSFNDESIEILKKIQKKQQKMSLVDKQPFENEILQSLLNNFLKKEKKIEEKQNKNNQKQLFSAKVFAQKMDCQKLIFDQFYQSMKQSIKERIDFARYNLKQMGTYRSKRLVYSITKKLSNVSKNSIVKRVFASQKNNHQIKAKSQISRKKHNNKGLKIHDSERNTVSFNKCMFDQKKLEQKIKQYYNRQQKKTSEHFYGCLVNKLINSQSQFAFQNKKTEQSGIMKIARATTPLQYSGYHELKRKKSFKFY